ncbi:MAG: PD-(D/E)XK nuclease family transposase, partial [Bacilli bacterium]|nr:PD-(D/E)XK nuclease family transposase [Bacilli bacterium]
MSKQIVPISFDPVFTGIFNDENNIDIVENFLSVYLNIPLEKIKGHVSIKSRKIESKPKKERKKEVDLVLDIDGKKLNIEMNNKFQTPIADRNVVFICRIHGGQLKVGDNKYTNIKESLQINLNSEKINDDSLVESYCFRNEKGKILSKKIRIDVVDIEKAKEFKYNKSEEKLARWLRALVSISLEELEKELGDDLMEKESKEKLIEEVERYSEDEEIYDMYKYHSKQELIQNSLIDEARLE